MKVPEPEIKVFCSRCSEQQDTEVVSPERAGRACPHCGETNRHIEINVSDQVGAIDQVTGVFREHGIKHWSKKFVSGEEYYRETNEVRTVVRVMDWKNRHDPQSYYELITNTDTGVVVRSVTEAFGQHKGHGAAKHSVPEFPDDWRRIAAYYIWEKEGCPHGRHINHWNRAKAELTRLWKQAHFRRSASKNEQRAT